MNTLGSLIRDVRTAHGMTPAQFAQALGRDTSYVSRLETGRNKQLPPPEELLRVAGVLPVSMADMLDAAGYRVTSAQPHVLHRVLERHLLTVAHGLSDEHLKALLGAARAFADIENESVRPISPSPMRS